MDKAIMNSTQQKIRVLFFLRESKNTKSLPSQELRLGAAYEYLKDDPLFQDIVIELHPRNFALRQVNRDQVLQSDEFAQLIATLEEIGREKDPPKVWILAVSMLRFGKEKGDIEAVLQILTDISDDLEVEIMPLDCFGLPTDKVIAILHEYFAAGETIKERFGSHCRQGRNVVADSQSENERCFVSSTVKSIKKSFKEEDAVWKPKIQRGLSLLREEEVGEDNDSKNTIAYTMPREDFEEYYLTVLANIKEFQGVGEDKTSFVYQQLSDLSNFVTDHVGNKCIGVYSRRSPYSTSKMIHGVPAEQTAFNFADILYHLSEDNQKQDVGLEDLDGVQIAIFFDDQKSRKCLTNPNYLSYFAALLSGAFYAVYTTEPIRISQDKEVVLLHEAACNYTQTKSKYTKELGKDVGEIAGMTEQRVSANGNNRSNFNSNLDQCRNKHLLPSANATAGQVSLELSLRMKNCEGTHLSKDEKFGSDEDSIVSIILSESESESEDEDEIDDSVV